MGTCKGLFSIPYILILTQINLLMHKTDSFSLVLLTFYFGRCVYKHQLFTNWTLLIPSWLLNLAYTMWRGSLWKPNMNDALCKTYK